MTFGELKASLEASGLPVYEYAAPSGASEYIVMAAYGFRRTRGDDRDALRWTRCQIDCFSQRAGAEREGGVFVFILNTLDALGIPFSVESTAWDNDAAAMRMIIQCDLF